MGQAPEQKLAGVKQATIGGSEAALKMGETPLDKGLGVFEIAEGTTIEEMKAIFWNANALVAPSYKLFQLNSRGKRYYYYIDEAGNPRFQPSVTTVLGAVMPENPFLTDWKISMGKEKAEAYTAERAAYGTFMHGCFEQVIVNRKYDLDNLREELRKYIEREKLPTSFINYTEDLKRDVLAFARWVKDYDVRPIAVEVALYHPELGYAGMVDLVASVRKYTIQEEAKATDKIAATYDKAAEKAVAQRDKAKSAAQVAYSKAVAKAKTEEDKAKAEADYNAALKAAEEALDDALITLGNDRNNAVEDARKVYGERLNGIIDFKSGRKGFYEEHQHQLNLYRLMWDANYPEHPIDFIANFSPKDWRTAPSYNYKDQSTGQPIQKTLLLLDLFRMDHSEEKTITTVSGQIDLDGADDLDANVSSVTLEDLVKGRKKPEEEELDEAPECDSLFDLMKEDE